VIEWINVNGRITAPEAAAISPLDRGFLYGDSVYETIRTYSSRPFRLAAHIARLRRSADALGIPYERATVEPGAATLATLERATGQESAIRIVLTRGVGGVGYDPASLGPPTVVIHLRPCPGIPAAWRSEGVDVAVVGVTRNAVTAVDPAIKSSNLLNNYLAWEAGRRLGVFEPLLLSPEGHVAEGASSNLFIVRAGRLATPQPATGILLGITREVVLEMARAATLPVDETTLTPEDLRDADEIFLTSTLKGILPVRRCDGWPVRDGRPGPITRRLMERFDSLVQEETKTGASPGATLR
jgi:branched-chain amino acid aminotransferase